MERIKILLVDDHEVVRVGLKMLLISQDNFEVVGDVGSADEALAFLNNNEVDVLLTDITMPERNGIDLAKEVKRKYKKINVLMLTMHMEDDFILSSMDAGAKGYVAKDSSKEDIIKAINIVAKGEVYLTGKVSDVLSKSLLQNRKQKKVITGYHLSCRELEILTCIVNGLSNKMIAPELNISEFTVNVHRYNIMQKMNANNTADMVRIAMKNKMVKAA